MAELHCYRGIQGSGKSTLAEKNAAKDGGRLVGRDRLRKLIGANGLGSKKQEQEVTEMQGRLIVNGLRYEQNVHVDDMNLKSVYVRRLMHLADRCKAEFVIHDLSHVPLEVCLARDLARTQGQVGQDMIRSNWERFIKGTNGKGLPVPSSGLYDARLLPPEPYEPDVTKPKAVLVDLDGTTALKGDRHIHDYDERVFYDLPNWPVIHAVRALIAFGITPIYLSGRKGYSECWTATCAWITKYISASPQRLYMRAPHDNRPDYFVKRDLFDEHIRDTWNVLFALDDRQQVVDMYREMGVNVFQVAEGMF